MVLLKLELKSSELSFKPAFPEIEAIVSRLITAIVESAQGLPRVEHVLFPDLQGCKLLIPAVELEELPIQEAREKATQMVRSNFIGPEK